MKKQVMALAVAALLAMSAFGLAACGGSSSSSAAASSSSASSESASSESASSESASSESASSESADAASSESAAASEKVEQKLEETASAEAVSFVGEWTMVEINYQGVVMGGDLAQFMGGDMVLDFADDGDVKVTLGDESESGEWEADGSDGLVIHDGSDDLVFEFDAEKGVLTLSGDQLDAGLDGAVIVFGNAGSDIDAPDYNFANSDSVHDAAFLEGSWKLSGASMEGLYVKGEVSNLVGYEIGFEFAADGTVVMTTEDDPTELTYEVSDSGAFLIAGEEQLEMRQIGDELAVDFSKVVGEDYVFVFSK